MNSNYADSEDERKRQRRLDANRRSAQKSRYRKLVMLNELQKSVTEMTSTNTSLKEENDVLRDQLSKILDLYNSGEPYSEELLENIMNSSSPPSKENDTEHQTPSDSDEDCDEDCDEDNDTAPKKPPSSVEKRKSKVVETTDANSRVSTSPILSSQQSRPPLLSGAGGNTAPQNIHLANGATLRIQQAIMQPPHPPEVLFNGGFHHQNSLNQPSAYSPLALYLPPPASSPYPNLVIANQQGQEFHRAIARAGMVGGVGANLQTPHVATALPVPAFVAAVRQQQQQQHIQHCVQADLATSNPFDVNAFAGFNNNR